MTTVVYIAGYGRSGSTLVDIALSQRAGVFGAGELSTMLRHVWPNNEFCACGHPVRGCPFWAPVMAEWLAGGVDPAAFLAAQRAVEPLLSSARRPQGAALRLFRTETARLFAIVARHAGCTAVVDSSKAPGRALALVGADGIDLRVVHLVRDPNAVAHSMRQTFAVDPAAGVQKPIAGRPTAFTALRWTAYNLFAERLARRLPEPGRFVRVRYEDFVADPSRELARIGAATGIDFAPVAASLAAGEPVRPCHQMAGSRVRMKGSLALAHDTAWQDALPRPARATVALLARPLMHAYGYAA